jgi:hypothetical protein
MRTKKNFIGIRQSVVVLTKVQTNSGTLSGQVGAYVRWGVIGAPDTAVKINTVCDAWVLEQDGLAFYHSYKISWLDTSPLAPAVIPYVNDASSCKSHYRENFVGE